jgi:hypothetical protein
VFRHDVRKTRIMEPDEIICCYVTTQQTGTVVTHTKAMIEELLEAVFSVRSAPSVYIAGVVGISPTTAAPTSFKSKLNLSFTRRTIGHCLGTFQTAKLCFG